MSCHALRPLPRGVARATTEHMPFVGHRTCATVMAQHAERAKRATDFGFDPESLTRARG